MTRFLPVALLSFVIAGTVVTTVFAPTDAAAAVRNPLIRTCLIKGGEFKARPDGSDDVPLCYFGNAGIGAQTLIDADAGVYDVASQVILADQAGSSCAAVSARSHDLVDGEKLCTFADGSKLTLSSVTAAPGNQDRLHLKEALSRR